MTDCADPQCFGMLECPCASFEAYCADGKDDDCDGGADCDDADCADPCSCNVQTCADAMTCCNVGCCDVDSDPRCCGGCGNACPIDLGVCSGGACYECKVNSDCDSGNPCAEGMCVGDHCMYSFLADMTPCTSGVCCAGECRTGGQCCSDLDCFPGCSGEALDCTHFSATDECESQDGCFPGPGSCSGSGPALDCLVHGSMDECLSCGCNWEGGLCRGVASECSILFDTRLCEICGCLPGGECMGFHQPCLSYPDPIACQDQRDCRWILGFACREYQCL
jgi:hypothetical protein